MNRTLGGLVVMGLIASVLVSQQGVAQSSPVQTSRSDPPLALAGTAPGQVDAVRIVVIPADLDRGEGRKAVHPVEAQVQIDDTSWRASIDPASIPAGFVHDNGVYDFLVEATGIERSYTTEVSARAVTSSAATGTTWMDASNTAHLTETGTARRGGSAKTAVVSPAAYQLLKETEDDGVTTAQYAAAADAPCSFWSVEAVGTRLRPTTIGTSYPLSNSTAWMKVSSSQGADYGVAFKVSQGAGAFTAAGSRFTRSGWSKTWEPSVANRAYRKEIEYTKYDYYCSDLRHRYAWRPTGETGGTSSAYGLERPDWRHCANQAPGAWSRDSSAGEAYSYDAAVQFAAIIGIDLSIKRNYSQQQFLTYYVRGQKKLCGNGSVPARAGKIMERFR